MKRFLLVLIIAFACPLPAKATIVADLSCKGSLSLRDGARITYQVSGLMELSDGGRILGQPNLAMTILRRERNGIERILRQSEPLSNFENNAPDADYSRLPFTGAFKAKPNDGSGIYFLPSADYQILIRMIPTQSGPRQAQVIHYLDRRRFVRSAAFPCTLQP